MYSFFFSSRIRHTSCALVTGVQTCALPIFSLHRSEGFGRGLAEAMYLGKPVIATRYSGNLDFMDERTAYLVDHELVPVQTGEYPFAEGQHWADEIGRAHV